MGIEVLPPDVNGSGLDFTVEDGADPLRPVRDQERRRRSDPVDAARRAERIGRFESLHELCAEVDPRLVNKRVLEALVQSGALDSSGDDAASWRPGSTPPWSTDRRSGPTGRRGRAVCSVPAAAGIRSGPRFSRTCRNGTKDPAEPREGLPRLLRLGSSAGSHATCSGTSPPIPPINCPGPREGRRSPYAAWSPT